MAGWLHLLSLGPALILKMLLLQLSTQTVFVTSVAEDRTSVCGHLSPAILYSDASERRWLIYILASLEVLGGVTISILFK